MGRRSGEKQKQPCRPGATKPLYHPDSPPEYKNPYGLMRPRNAGLAARTVGPRRLRNHIPPPLPAGFHLLRLSYRVVCTAYSLFHCRYYFVYIIIMPRLAAVNPKFMRDIRQAPPNSRTAAILYRYAFMLCGSNGFAPKSGASHCVRKPSSESLSETVMLSKPKRVIKRSK